MRVNVYLYELALKKINRAQKMQKCERDLRLVATSLIALISIILCCTLCTVYLNDSAQNCKKDVNY